MHDISADGRENVPPFDRSPYDGYALRASDTAAAAKTAPVTLRILEEIPAGAVPSKTVRSGTATKALTGAPVPDGADAVVMYEKTQFTKDSVTLFGPVKPGENIVRTGEDIQRGACLASCGDLIDPGLAGTLAAQGVSTPLVYKKCPLARKSLPESRLFRQAESRRFHGGTSLFDY